MGSHGCQTISADSSGVSHIVLMPTACPQSLQVIKVAPAIFLVAMYIFESYALLAGRARSVGTAPVIVSSGLLIARRVRRESFVPDGLRTKVTVNNVRLQSDA
jgi:hypothetical protein